MDVCSNESVIDQPPQFVPASFFLVLPSVYVSSTPLIRVENSADKIIFFILNFKLQFKFYDLNYNNFEFEFFF